MKPIRRVGPSHYSGSDFEPESRCWFSLRFKARSKETPGSLIQALRDDGLKDDGLKDDELKR